MREAQWTHGYISAPLGSEWNGLGSSPSRGHCVVFLGMVIYLVSRSKMRPSRPPIYFTLEGKMIIRK